MEYTQLRNEALQAALTFYKSKTCRLPKPVRDGNLIVIEVNCMNGDMTCTNGQVINTSTECMCITTKVYNYLLSILKPQNK